MGFALLLRNLRLKARGRSNAIDMMAGLKHELMQERKRRAEAELEASTLRRRLSRLEKPRDPQGRYTTTRGAATCETSSQQTNAWPRVT